MGHGTGRSSGKMEKKVNFTEYNLVLQKLTELRMYVDTMADSVLVGHKESKDEFAKEVTLIAGCIFKLLN